MIKMEKIDLHIHTNLSDGDCSINEVVQICKNNNCKKIAITDHEIIMDYAVVALQNDLDIINGIEFNTDERGMHILGYGIKDINNVQKQMDLLHMENEDVSLKLIKKLQNLNYNISKEQILIYLFSNNIKCKYLDKRHIVKYLIYKGYAKNVLDAYKNIIGRGTSLYLPLKKIASKNILELIANSGGISVLAHPDTLGLNINELDTKVKELVEFGLNGIEVINGNCNNCHAQEYKKLSDKYGILETAGSDFHSIKDNNIGIEADSEIFEKVKRLI